jgi:hypothetical protein
VIIVSTHLLQTITGIRAIFCFTNKIFWTKGTSWAGSSTPRLNDNH